jgi:hypothetical protein
MEVQYRQCVVLPTMRSTGELASVFTVHSDSIGTGSAWLPSFVHALFEREREDGLRRTVTPILQSSTVTKVCI